MIPVFEWYFYPECALKNTNAMLKLQTNRNIKFEGFDILDSQSAQGYSDSQGKDSEDNLTNEYEEEKSFREFADDYYHVSSSNNTPRTEYKILNTPRNV